MFAKFLEIRIMEKSGLYEVPVVEVMEILVERVFADSLTAGGGMSIDGWERDDIESGVAE